MARQFIYQMQGLRKILNNGDEVLKGIWLSFYPGAKIGVIGPNGSGKTSVIRVMAGVDKDFEGHTWIDPDAKVGYLAQEPHLDTNLTVKENIELGVHKQRQLLDRYEEVSELFADEMTDDEMEALINEQAEIQDQIDAGNLWDLDRMVEIAMDALRVPPPDADVNHISGGEMRRVALCQLLLAKPDLLLLDEPTNHLDAESVAWLERHLGEYEGTVVFITHDRYFLDNVAKWILEMDAGQGIPWEGNYSSWLEQKQQKVSESEARRRGLQKELDWIKLSQRDRRTRTKARLTRYEDLLQQLDQGEETRTRTDIRLPPGKRLGDIVVRAEHVSKSFNERLLFDDLTLDLPRGGIVGVIGANGAGKTTFFRMINQELIPDSGILKVGETVDLAYVNQQRDNLDDDKSVWENISGGHDLMQVGNHELNSRAYVSAFGFKGTRQQQLVGTLSGGERNRVHLAKLLQSGGNLLLLDEPTNDLDVDTLRALEEALLKFAGCVVVVTHDRWFLDRIATHMLAFEGNSEVVWFEGNYQDYERDRRKRLGQDADQPRRIKYKKLSR
ncbi:MAG: energy-dependent translational throttle protein EttA [Proteobacteria bacterium]|nr:energy-dependent translational throttle protein EttA [Pseudomonadota bacterium]